MSNRSVQHSLHYIGENVPHGCYVLRIYVTQPLEMPFGRFKGGQCIAMDPGDYLYVGSAMAQKGATCLARRLVRHATRTAGKPHAIRAAMLREFPQRGLIQTEFRAPQIKRFKWNVDHLLDVSTVELVSAYVIRSSENLEFSVADMLQSDRATVSFEKGLGAHDHKGATHLLRVDAKENWWRELPAKIDALRISLIGAIAKAGTVGRNCSAF